MSILENRNYFIQPTQEGIYILLIKAREEDASASAILYDGRDNALFLRRPKETILLDYINPVIHQKLLESPYVIVLELNIESENVLRSYQVPMQRVDEVFVA